LANGTYGDESVSTAIYMIPDKRFSVDDPNAMVVVDVNPVTVTLAPGENVTFMFHAFGRRRSSSYTDEDPVYTCNTSPTTTYCPKVGNDFGENPTTVDPDVVVTTDAPTSASTPAPTVGPTSAPTVAPTDAPTVNDPLSTQTPTESPTGSPTISPTPYVYVSIQIGGVVEER